MKRLLLFTLLPFIYVSSYAQWWSDRQQFEHDTINFNKDYPNLKIDSSTENIWQIARPGKAFLDSAFSKDRAIITDSTGFYPMNNHSWFDIFIGAFNYGDNYSEGFPWDVFIQFRHKYDTDAGRDGGYITVSFDNGMSWNNIIQKDFYLGVINPSDAYEASENLYSEDDLLYNGEEGFSGRSDGWVTTWFAWYDLPAKKRSQMLSPATL